MSKYVNKVVLSGAMTISNKIKAYTQYGEVVFTGANLKVRGDVVTQDGEVLTDKFKTNKPLKTKSASIAEAMKDLENEKVLVTGELITEPWKGEGDKITWVDVIFVTDIEPLETASI